MTGLGIGDYIMERVGLSKVSYALTKETFKRIEKATNAIVPIVEQDGTIIGFSVELEFNNEISNRGIDTYISILLNSFSDIIMRDFVLGKRHLTWGGNEYLVTGYEVLGANSETPQINLEVA